MEAKNIAHSPSLEIPVSEAPADENTNIGAGSARRRRRSFRWGRWSVLALILVLAGTGAYYWTSHREPQLRYITAPVKYGTVAVSLTATGTVNPVTVVEVGTYVSGPIVRWYCDYNARVTVGQLCAQIDPRPFQMVADQAAANLAVARTRRAWPTLKQPTSVTSSSWSPGSSLKPRLRVTRAPTTRRWPRSAMTHRRSKSAKPRSTLRRLT